jgi:hypothetical protein
MQLLERCARHEGDHGDGGHKTEAQRQRQQLSPSQDEFSSGMPPRRLVGSREHSDPLIGQYGVFEGLTS